jgi:hypothetical protein
MRSNIKIGIVGTLACVAILVWAVAFPSAAQHAGAGRQANCNVANVAGTYAYAAFGTISAGNPAGFPAGPYNSAATLVLDGAGNFIVDAKTSYNGVILDEHFEGTYVVGEDCAVTFLVQGVPFVYAIFTNNRKEARGMSLIPGTNVTFLTVAR